MQPEMKLLVGLLTNNDIPFELRTDNLFGCSQVFYPSRNDCICDVICNAMSYGNEVGLLEIMGLTKNGDDVEGYLTGQEVFERICNHYSLHKK